MKPLNLPVAQLHRLQLKMKLFQHFISQPQLVVEPNLGPRELRGQAQADSNSEKAKQYHQHNAETEFLRALILSFHARVSSVKGSKQCSFSPVLGIRQL